MQITKISSELTKLKVELWLLVTVLITGLCLVFYGKFIFGFILILLVYIRLIDMRKYLAYLTKEIEGMNENGKSKNKNL